MRGFEKLERNIDSTARIAFIVVFVIVPVPLPYGFGKLGPLEAVPLGPRNTLALSSSLALQIVLWRRRTKRK